MHGRPVCMEGVLFVLQLDKKPWTSAKFPNSLLSFQHAEAVQAISIYIARAIGDDLNFVNLR